MEKIISDKRLTWIDALKGIACLIVASGHAYDNFSVEASGEFRHVVEIVFAPFINGGLMVCVFAVLSGLLATKSIGKKIALVRGCVRRYIQLTVPLLTTGILAYVVSNLGIRNMEPISIKTAVLQGVGGGVLLLGQSTINPAFWMMRSLFFGSLLCIILNAVMYHIQSNRYRLLLVILFIGGSIIIRDHVIMSCILGYFIGLINMNSCFVGKVDRKFLIVLLIASFILMGWGHHWGYILITTYIHPLPKSLDAVAKWMSLYSALFVFALSNLRRLQQLVSRKVLVFLGRCSIGVYCFHNLVIGTIGFGIANLLDMCLGINGTVVCIVAWGSVIICTILVAYVYEITIGKKVSRLLVKMK